MLEKSEQDLFFEQAEKEASAAYNAIMAAKRREWRKIVRTSKKEQAEIVKKRINVVPTKQTKMSELCPNTDKELLPQRSSLVQFLASLI